MVEQTSATESIRWAAKLENVREVSLSGSADLAYWRRELEPYELSPLDERGRAQVMIVAAEGKYLGLTFREISFSVLVEPRDGQFGQQAAFLVQAFNSVRFFAFCERVLFSTPYLHAEIDVASEFPFAFRLQAPRGCSFSVQMDRLWPRASYNDDDEWRGAIYLPASSDHNNGRMFVAHLEGETQTAPFLPADSLKISPGESLRALLESNFEPTGWQVRVHAKHAKSKTFSARNR